MKKRSVIFLGLGLALMNGGITLALTTQELNNYALDVYTERYVGSRRLEDYLEANGVNIKEYNKYLKELDAYNKSTEFTWERIENGSLIIDEILFSDEAVRKEYEKVLDVLKSERLAYEFVKKNMLNDPEEFISKFNSNIKDMGKVRKAVEEKYGRKITGVEETMFDRFDDYRYVLYMSVNGGYFAPKDEEISMDMAEDMIHEGYGYKILGLTDEDIKKYTEFIKKRDEYDKILISYAKSYSMFQTIHTEIMSKYGKDIYESLSDKERMNIYKKSLEGFIFDEKKAMKEIINVLISKGILSKEDLVVEGENSVIEQGNSGVDPWNELQKYLEEKNKLSSKIQLLSSIYSTNGISNVFENLGESFVFAKYKDVEINTQIRLSIDDKLEGEMIGRLFETIEKELGIKTIFSKDKVLTFFENKVNVFDLSFDEKEGIEFYKLVEIFKKIGINLYLKDIDFNESSEIESSESSNDYIYKMILNFENRMVEFNLGESKEIKISYIRELFRTLDVKFITSLDSVLVCKDNEIKISKVFGTDDNEISIDDLKTLLEDIGEKVNIQVIKEGM